VGALTAFILMSLALIFSVVGAYSLAKRRGPGIEVVGSGFGDGGTVLSCIRCVFVLFQHVGLGLVG
jgi:hypothetical protein